MPLILPVVSGFFDSLPSFLLVRVFVPFTQLYIHQFFLLLSMFPFLHWQSRSFSSTSLSLSSPCSFSFLSSIFSVFCTLLFHPFCLQTFRSLSRFHSEPISLALFPHWHSLHLLLFPPSPDLCPYINTLSNIIILLLLLSLFYFIYHYYLSLVCLVRGSFVEGVTQVFELAPFPLPLILFTLPLSLVVVEHHHFRLLNIHFKLFFFTYFPRLLIISFISLSLFATITKSSTNARLQTFSIPLLCEEYIFSNFCTCFF
jgi:hypothetical protein